MELKKIVEDFYLNKGNRIEKEDNYSKLSESFRYIAETILSGYFKVSKNNSDSYVTVHPTCVEIYYHEEGECDNKVKDYIVYHRNSDDGKLKKDIFPIGILHNHLSGIDLTFEGQGGDGEPIRFSALIREFWVNSCNKKKDIYEMNVLGNSSESKPDKMPTHLYDALYSQFSVFDGFSIKWLDGTEDERKKIKCIGTRINVPQYELNKTTNKIEKVHVRCDNEIKTLNKKYKQCLRMWRYSINEI